ncbi:hypothetical protein JHK87_031724 [Glycine soja]|nr:hypothetical protein JHK87_031724 [Glycine soja]
MATVQYALCSAAKENKVKAVSARVMKVLVELMVDLGLSMVYLVSVVMAVVEERVALVHSAILDTWLPKQVAFIQCKKI